MMEWYQSEIPDVLQRLETNSDQGLTDAEVTARREKFGLNELKERPAKSPWKILWEQLTGIMVVILIVSAVISLILGETVDSVVILIIVVLNSVLGFTQEYRAEQAMAALKKMAVPIVKVRRNGHIQEIKAQELVPGDVVLLEAGNAIPADCRVIEAANLRAQEAVLTGESVPVEKRTAVLSGEHVALGDQRNMLFMGTAITYGRGTAVVVETGMKTQLGHIADLIQSVTGEMTPLQRRLDQLGKGLAIAALAIVAVVFAMGVLRGEDVRLMFMTAISMAVAAVPEGLPAVVTIALALGAQRMLSRRALIRKLPAVETLGSVTVICSDKTGTLTQNRMTVNVLDVAGNRFDLSERMRDFSPSILKGDEIASDVQANPAMMMMLAGSALCNDAVLEANTDQVGSFSTVGDPTEGALVVAAAQAGMWKNDLEKAMPRVSELPFDSERKRMTTVHDFSAERLPAPLAAVWTKHPIGPAKPYMAITKGSVDGLLDISQRVWVDGRTEVINEEWRKRIIESNNLLAQSGIRVLGVAFQQRDTAATDDPSYPLEHDLIFIGMVGMIDPARPEVQAAVRTAKTAGIRPIMITGDHPLTAMYIARELGIAVNDRVITGQQLATMTVEELETQVDEVSVFARVSPEHKLKIVQALQDKGQVVAMTGDGVNDAPALKRSDIGVAMGITGTDVSKEAADMVLLDDNFATIVAAVEEGRRIYDNIRKFIKYTMTSNSGEIWVMLLGPLVGMPLPLQPLQILWVNLVTDGLPGLALTVEPAESNTMSRKPYPPQESIFGRGMARDIVWVGLVMGLVSLGMGYWFWVTDHVAWQTMVFTTLTLAQMGHALVVRSERDSIFKIGLLSNKAMLGSVLLTFVLQLMVIYVPFLQEVFNTVPLSASELIVSLAMSTVVLFSVELSKWIARRKEQ